MRALDYHASTKHSWERIRANPHSLDFANMPLPFKIYTDLARQPLSTDLPDSAVPALAALAEPGAHAGGDRVPGRNELAHLLSAVGITKRRRYPGGEMLFRGAPCTGALYHIEVYVICTDLKDLPAGVYQFQPKDSSVCLLRPGDCRQVLIDASGAHAAVADAPVVLVLTSTWWRNAWKYQARAYRHAWWDSGCMAANLLAQAAALELPAALVAGYADDPVNRLLDVDPEKEASLMLVPIGRGGPAQAAAPPRLAPLGLSTEPLSHHEVAYPDIPAVHAASCLNTGAEAAAWRGAMDGGTEASPERLVPLQPAADDAVPAEPLEAVIRRRGSSRRFTGKNISFTALSTILDRTDRTIAADFRAPSGASLCDLYLIVNAVDGLPAGTYAYRPAHGGLEPLREGTFREEATALALGQDLAGEASVNLYFLADLQRVTARFGDRGYRAAELEGGIRGGRVYLAAYALGLGATGLAFLDAPYGSGAAAATPGRRGARRACGRTPSRPRRLPPAARRGRPDRAGARRCMGRGDGHTGGGRRGFGHQHRRPLCRERGHDIRQDPRRRSPARRPADEAGGGPATDPYLRPGRRSRVGLALCPCPGDRREPRQGGLRWRHDPAPRRDIRSG